MLVVSSASGHVVCTILAPPTHVQPVPLSKLKDGFLDSTRRHGSAQHILVPAVKQFGYLSMSPPPT